MVFAIWIKFYTLKSPTSLIINTKSQTFILNRSSLRRRGRDDSTKSQSKEMRTIKVLKYLYFYFRKKVFPILEEDIPDVSLKQQTPLIYLSCHRLVWETKEERKEGGRLTDLIRRQSEVVLYTTVSQYPFKRLCRDRSKSLSTLSFLYVWFLEVTFWVDTTTCID